MRPTGSTLVSPGNLAVTAHPQIGLTGAVAKPHANAPVATKVPIMLGFLGRPRTGWLPQRLCGNMR